MGLRHSLSETTAVSCKTDKVFLLLEKSSFPQQDLVTGLSFMPLQVSITSLN